MSATSHSHPSSATASPPFLDEHAINWPATANPQLFIAHHPSVAVTAVGHRWVQLKIGTELTASAIRTDRILHEAHLT